MQASKSVSDSVTILLFPFFAWLMWMIRASRSISPTRRSNISDIRIPVQYNMGKMQALAFEIFGSFSIGCGIGLGMMQDSRHFPNGEHIGDIGVLSVSFLKWHNIDIFHPFNGDHIFTQGSDDLALVPKITGLFVCTSLEKPHNGFAVKTWLISRVFHAVVVK